MTQDNIPAAAERSLHILISTGEVSGDLQGSFLIKALYRQAHALGLTLRISALGGQRMAAGGAALVGRTTEIGSIGIFEAIPYVLPTLRIQHEVKQKLRKDPVDLVVFIDYMNPNLNLGQFLRKAYPSLHTAYYIAPQQWTWAFSEKDSQAIVSISDKMIAVFPQEADYYRKFGADIAYYGHPLIDQFADPPAPAEARKKLGFTPEDLIITLLPASRRQEVKYVLPILLAVAAQIQKAESGAKFLVPISSSQLRPAIEQAIAQFGVNARVIEGDARLAIAAADLVLNKSGTVNLEVALMKVPQIVVYRLNPLTARIAYYLLNLRLDHVSPVNLFVNKTIVPEFIQWDATTAAITAASLKLLRDSDARGAMLAGYDELCQQMGEPGVCDRVAESLLSLVLGSKPRTAVT